MSAVVWCPSRPQALALPGKIVIRHTMIIQPARPLASHPLRFLKSIPASSLFPALEVIDRACRRYGDRHQFPSFSAKLIHLLFDDKVLAAKAAARLFAQARIAGWGEIALRAGDYKI